MANEFLVDIVGLRNAQGRFARQSSEPVMTAIQLERATVLSKLVEEEARRAAPRSPIPPVSGTRFADGLTAHASATGTGFRIELNTDKPQLRAWLRDGTQPHEIQAVNASALRFEVAGNTIFAKLVHHPGTRPSSWEDRLRSIVEPASRVEAGNIGARLAEGLAGRL